MRYSSRKARLAHGVTVAESKTGGIIYTVGGSAEVSFKVKKKQMKVIIELSPPQVGGAGHIDMEQLEPGVNIIFVLPCLSDF